MPARVTSVFDLVDRLLGRATASWSSMLRHLALLVVPLLVLFAAVGALLAYLGGHPDLVSALTAGAATATATGTAALLARRRRVTRTRRHSSGRNR